MKIAIVSSRFPFPLEKGDKLRLYHQIKSLSEIHQIYLHAIVDQSIPEEDIDHLRVFCAGVKIYFIPNWKSKWRIASHVFSKMPFQVQYFLNSGIKKQLREDILAINPDLIYCQLIRMTEYVKNLAFPKCLDYMDAFSVVMKRRAEKTTGLMKMIVKSEAKRVQHYEKYIYPYFDGHLAITRADAGHIFPNGQDRIHIVPNGVDINYFDFGEISEPEFDIVFVGNMGYHPNIVAATRLVKKILPKIEDRSVKVLIAGARPGKLIQQLESDSVKVTGWLKDIRTAYWNAKIFIAPMETGAGQQNKILEAMACGIPCLTSSLVNQGIAASPAEEIFLAESDAEFAAKAEQLLKDSELRDEISMKARKFVSENFSWERAGNELTTYLSNLKKNPRNI